LVPLLRNGVAVVAAPNQLYTDDVESAALLRRQLGASGISFVFQNDTLINADLLRRCYLLAERLQSIFTLGTALFRVGEGIGERIGERAGARDALVMVSHSLNNAPDYLGKRQYVAKDILYLERMNAIAAFFLETGEAPQSNRLEPWTTNDVGLDVRLWRALGTKRKNVTIEAEGFEAAAVDHRLIAVLLELVRNTADRGPGGRLKVHRANSGLTIESVSKCVASGVNKARDALEAVQRGHRQYHGLGFVLMLLDVMANQATEVDFLIVRNQESSRAQCEEFVTISLPKSKAAARLRVEHEVRDLVAKEDNEVDLRWMFTVRGLPNILVRGTA